jgi:hypothetical protein
MAYNAACSITRNAGSGVERKKAAVKRQTQRLGPRQRAKACNWMLASYDEQRENNCIRR